MASDENPCQARRRYTSRTLARLRNFAISWPRLLDVTEIKAVLRDFAARPRRALVVFHL